MLEKFVEFIKSVRWFNVFVALVIVAGSISLVVVTVKGVKKSNPEKTEQTTVAPASALEKYYFVVYNFQDKKGNSGYGNIILSMEKGKLFSPMFVQNYLAQTWDVNRVVIQNFVEITKEQTATTSTN